MDSVWVQTASKPSFSALNGDIKTDVLIIGGGIVGILCAQKLKEAGVDYVLVEANKICGGITKNTTAKITSQHRFIYHDLIKKFGAEKAKLYLQANQSAVNEYRELCKNIDCDFEEKPSFVYSIEGKRIIERELSALENIGFSANFVSTTSLPFSTAGAIKFDGQAQFNPLKFAYAISKDLKIFEDTKVLEFLGDKIKTDKGEIKAKKIIVATHFPIFNKHGLYFMKMFQHRSYVLALKNAPDMGGTYVDADEKGLSFRNYKDLLLLGGGSHRTGESGGNWLELTKFKDKYFKNAKVTDKWATQDCITLDGIPYIGQYSKNTPDLYVATGFNKWGMSFAMVAADLLKDLILNKKNVYTEVFSPSRTMLRPQLAVNLSKTMFNLITPTVPRCPHLGCALKYNAQEKSWDCPCHGSRFTEDKKLIDNPATGNIKK